MTYQLMEIFEKQSAELYSLALLLTGSVDRSVEAFSRALEFDEENPVFGEFMSEWARKLVIGEALGTIETELRMSRHRVARASEEDCDSKWTRRTFVGQKEFEEAVAEIDAFPRCAMLLTIFEGMPAAAVAVMLNADEALVRKAQRIAIVQLTRQLAGESAREAHAGRGPSPVPVLSLG